MKLLPIHGTNAKIPRERSLKQGACLLFENILLKMACGTMWRKFFSKTPGQPVENGVTLITAMVCLSQKGLGQAWDKLGQTGPSFLLSPLLSKA